ncbi:hypothetical protein SAMN05216388_101740 [Halorientalis persicus]|uniref:Uncharacterized protein n=1 Tax=Halorientalis persicus TaxID=1367881 RepID=A0A1H8RV88_9EURY|nr:hypothetical protein [Halorientalis persicus]SEO70068.1 hypothetical protein SAMN05216388_101740 [Halorientalis persicus]
MSDAKETPDADEVPPPEADEDWVRVERGHAFIGMRVAITTDARTVEGPITAIWEYRGDPTRVEVEPDEGEPLNANPKSDHVEVLG